MVPLIYIELVQISKKKKKKIQRKWIEKKGNMQFIKRNLNGKPTKERQRQRQGEKRKEEEDEVKRKKKENGA